MSPVLDLVQVIASDGTTVAVNGKLLRALKEFLDDKKSGQIILEMKDGIVADAKVSHSVR